MIVASVGFLKTNPNPSAEDVAGALTRNVCRCGTQPRILAAVLSVNQRNHGGSR